jgi:hypothetical protein
MRGLYIDTGSITTYSEGFQSTVIFSQGHDGRLTMTGAIIREDQEIAFTTTKVGEVKGPRPRDTTIRTKWEQYKPRHVFGIA